MFENAEHLTTEHKAALLDNILEILVKGKTYALACKGDSGEKPCRVCVGQLEEIEMVELIVAQAPVKCLVLTDEKNTFFGLEREDKKSMSLVKSYFSKNPLEVLLSAIGFVPTRKM